MNKPTRADIHIIGRNSNWARQGIDRALKTHVYNDRTAWQKFLRLFLITLGVGFTVAGIVFFFAYNWAYLHRFVKLGIVGSLVVTATVAAVLPKGNAVVKNMVLTGAAVLVGVLFAVYGQIYQTGANAYDFFLAWTLFVLLWTAVSSFAPLWLLFIALLNTTIILYAEQVAAWPGVLVCTLLFTVNIVVLAASVFITAKYNRSVPLWFVNIIALAAATAATTGIVNGIYDAYHPSFPVLSLMTAIAYFVGVRHGLQAKSSFYLSVIPFSLIVIISALLFRASESEGMFLMVGIFIITSVTLVIKNLITMQKRWANEK